MAPAPQLRADALSSLVPFALDEGFWGDTRGWNMPSHRIPLAMTPTPVHPWHVHAAADQDRSGALAQFAISIKRDDMTGSTLGGNKVRKLEFELADALRRGATDVIACGAVQSNYARAACAAAVQCGLRPHAVLRSPTPEGGDAAFGFEGNALVHRMIGTDVRLSPRVPFESGLLPRMRALERELFAKDESVSHILPVGGTGPEGTWGYVLAWQELREQLSDAQWSELTDVFVATGSGGTAAGLAIANALTGSGKRVHAVCVCDDAEYFLGQCDALIAAMGLGAAVPPARSILSVVEGFKGPAGYGSTSDGLLAQQQAVAHLTGVPLDPVYTGKGLQGMLACAQRHGSSTDEFGEHFHGLGGGGLLFWHTGGLLGAMDGVLGSALRRGAVPSATRAPPAC